MDKMFLSRDAILGFDDRQLAEVWVPQWDSWVRVRALSAAERDDYEQRAIDSQAAKGKNASTQVRGLRARLVVMGACLPDGKPLFSDADVVALNEKNGSAIDLLASKISELSGLSKGAVEDAKGN